MWYMNLVCFLPTKPTVIIRIHFGHYVGKYSPGYLMSFYLVCRHLNMFSYLCLLIRSLPMLNNSSVQPSPRPPVLCPHAHESPSHRLACPFLRETTRLAACEKTGWCGWRDSLLWCDWPWRWILQVTYVAGVSSKITILNCVVSFFCKEFIVVKKM